MNATACSPPCAPNWTWPDHPTVLVIEDVHWADDATLDALRYLIRRIADLQAVLVLTYRDDELNREHPLHGLLGQASAATMCGIWPLHRLSQGSGAAAQRGRLRSTADDLFALTSGGSVLRRRNCSPRRRASAFRARSWMPCLARVRAWTRRCRSARAAGRSPVRAGALARRRARAGQARRRWRRWRQPRSATAHRVRPQDRLPS